MDWTAYYEVMPASEITLGIDLEADRMVDSIKLFVTDNLLRKTIQSHEAASSPTVQHASN